MKKGIVLISGIIVLLGCSNIASVNNNKDTPLQEVFVNTSKTDKIVDTSLIDFLKNPANCNMRLSHGALQGTNHSKDSTGYLGFADFYDCAETYRIIFLYKDIGQRATLGYDSLSKIFFSKQQKNNGFIDFKGFAFIFPQKDPDMLGENKDNIDYPINVRAYQRTGQTTWLFMAQIKAKSFEELSSFEFRTIYGLAH
jgi:hypothetical protein